MDVIRESVYGTKWRTKVYHGVVPNQSRSSSENDEKSQRNGTRINKLNDPSALLLSSEEDDENEEVDNHIYHPQPKVSTIILPIVNSNSKTLRKQENVKTQHPD